MEASLTKVERGPAAGTEAAKPKAKDQRGLLSILVQECLKSPYVWLFAVSYFWVHPPPLGQPAQHATFCTHSVASNS